jgi:hypothetical protein
LTIIHNPLLYREKNHNLLALHPIPTFNVANNKRAAGGGKLLNEYRFSTSAGRIDQVKSNSKTGI